MIKMKYALAVALPLLAFSASAERHLPVMSQEDFCRYHAYASEMAAVYKAQGFEEDYVVRVLKLTSQQTKYPNMQIMGIVIAPDVENTVSKAFSYRGTANQFGQSRYLECIEALSE